MTEGDHTDPDLDPTPGPDARPASAPSFDGADPTLAEAGAPPLARRDESLAHGTQIGRYMVLQMIGRGGMGAVYAAHDPQLDRQVALKLLHSPRGDAPERLVREAQALAVKSGGNDTHSKAKSQLDNNAAAILEGAAGTAEIRLEVNGVDITETIDLSTMAGAAGKTRGPADKKFDSSLELTTTDLNKLARELYELAKAAGGGP